MRDRNEEWRNQVNREIEYTREPLNKDGELVITDRRIALNGVITMGTADFVADRVNYFNNQSSEFPIFLVIDSSPGGSVMAGYKILKTMEGSAAPVYVVVKSFAASMAAGITTLAKHSFAYPNAIILHHQLTNLNAGNPVQQRENLREVEEWWKRLAGPVAAKMGVPLEEFVRQMYAHNSEGDWREFGDAAVKTALGGRHGGAHPRGVVGQEPGQVQRGGGQPAAGVLPVAAGAAGGRQRPAARGPAAAGPVRLLVPVQRGRVLPGAVIQVDGALRRAVGLPRQRAG